MCLDLEKQTMTKDAPDDYPSKQEILKTISDAVYAQYPKKKWNELSEVEINALVDFLNSSNIDIKEFIKKIERMSKEMNT